MLVPLLLVGCWDERLYKNSSVVSLIGFEGEIGNVTAYYAYPEATTEEMKTVVITGKGVSPRDVRQNADQKTEQVMDLSELSTVLISEKTAKNDLYQYLDSYFRDSFNPITPKLAIIEGKMKAFFDLTEQMQSTSGEFYDRFITSLEENSLVIPYTLQTAGSLLFENAQDLVLPYIKMDEEDRPMANGLALFSGRSFTGETLNTEQGVLLNILNKSLGHVARITDLYEGSPLSVRVNKVKRNINVSEDEIEIKLKLEVVITEYPKDHIQDKQTQTDIEQFLTDKVEREMNEMMEKLQKAKSDAIGLGRIVRAYHTSYFEKDWSKKFSTLKIPIKVDVEIVKTGILY